MRRVILFDIDGTLVFSRRDVGGGAMLRVLRRLFSSIPGDQFTREGVRLGGRCDPAIAQDVAVNAGVSVEEFFAVQTQFEEAYRSEMRIAMQKGRVNKDVVQCPGAGRLLDALKEKYQLGLLTGNYDFNAVTKLMTVDIDPALFRFGAYGNDAQERDLLPPIALQREAALHGFHGTASTLLLGDTVEDVLCAHSSSIPVLAVGSGCTPTYELEDHRPTYALDSLEETDQVLDLIESHFTALRPTAAVCRKLERKLRCVGMCF